MTRYAACLTLLLGAGLARAGQGVIDGWLVAWEASGPYAAKKATPKTLHERLFDPELPGDRKAKWRPVAAVDGPDGCKVVDLLAAVAKRQNVCGYLRTRIISPAAVKAVLEVGGDDTVRVYVNGLCVLDENAPGSLKRDRGKVTVRLRKGANPMLVKVTQGSADWRCRIRLVTPGGRPMKSISAGPRPAAGDVFVIPPREAAPIEFVGDYQGVRTGKDGSTRKWIGQVIGLIGGRFRMKLNERFDDPVEPIVVLDGVMEDPAAAAPKVVLSGRSNRGPLPGALWQAEITGGAVTGSFEGPEAGTFRLKKVVRTSPTLGAAPPAGALVLLGAGTTKLDAWKIARKNTPLAWKLLPGGVMRIVPRSGWAVSKQTFGDHRLHIEFRAPYQPHHSGQKRGNSGVYLQGRYEVQVLDSYTLERRDNHCGGIYKVSRPAVNMCYPPETWQTFDIEFTAPKFDGKKKTADARLTVRHNGVVIHKDRRVPNMTGGCLDKDVHKPGGLALQDHGDPVEFRNVWVVTK